MKALSNAVAREYWVWQKEEGNLIPPYFDKITIWMTAGVR
jgi:hypothetical protein